MKKDVKLVVNAVKEIIDEFDDAYIDVKDALKILEVTAGGEDEVVDFLKTAGDRCSCDCDKCKSDDWDDEEDEEDNVEIVDTFEIKSDSQGRISLPKRILKALEENSCVDDYEVGIKIKRDALDRRIEISEKDDDDDTDWTYIAPTSAGQIIFSARKVFKPNTDLTLEIYSDGVAYIMPSSC